MKQSKDNDDNGDGGHTTNVKPQDTNALIAQVLQQLVANQPQRVITEDSPEYNARLRKEGFFDYFPKPVYQNGHTAEPRGLSEQTRERASSLAPGKYLGGKVTVEEAPNGGVHIKYKSVTVEDRMSQPFRDFTDLVDRVWSEMTQPVSA